MSIVQKATEDFKVPEILERRTLPEEFRGTRYLDDEEVMVSSLVDQNGHISRIFDFMVVLTRIEKIDHRLFCLELIKNYLTKEQSLQFVENGGLRILRRWMKIAEDADNVDELSFLLGVCEKLPFVESAVRHAEIGKSIKRLSKHVSNSGRNANELHSTANRIMELWKKQILAAQEVVKTETPKPFVKETHVSSAPKEKEKKSLVEAIKAAQAPSTEDNKSAAEAKTSESSSFPSSGGVTSKSTPVAKSTRLIDLIRRSEPIAPSATVTPSPFNAFASENNSGATTPLVAASKPSGEKRERRSLDMEASAKKLLESRQQQQRSGADSYAATDDSTAMDVVASISEVKPLGKGGLKSKSVTKKKLNISWADETGGLLREVRYIEVDKIKSSVANYKNHKELVKREKQMERETNFTGKLEEEVMTKTTDWRTPRRLVLPIDITDNMGHPTESKEIEVQQSRQKIALSAVYLDEGLIPDKPDDDDEMKSNVTPTNTYLNAMDVDDDSAPKPVEKPAVHELSWYMEDETPVVQTPAPAVPSSGMMGNAMMPHVGGMNAGVYTGGMYGGDMMMPNPAAMNPSMMAAGYNNGMNHMHMLGSTYTPNMMMMNNSMNIGNPAMNPMAYGMMNNGGYPHTNGHGNGMLFSNNMPAIGGFNINTNHLLMAASMGDMPMFFNALPGSLQQVVDQLAVKLLMQDPPLVVTLLHDNGSVNVFNLQLLQKSTSSTDYRMKINLPHQNQSLSSGSTSRWGMATNMSNGGGMSMPMANMAGMQASMGGMQPQQQQQQQPQQQQQQQTTARKSHVPCRYYNTAKGCMHGEKCPFGHFNVSSVSSNSSSSNGSSMGSASMGMDLSSVTSAAVAAAAAAASALKATGNFNTNGAGPGHGGSHRPGVSMMGSNIVAAGRTNRRR